MKQQSEWTSDQSTKLYALQRWSEGYFSIKDSGRVQAHGHRDSKHTIDLMDVVERARDKGYQLPLLVRFNDILRDRITEINNSFLRAIELCDYKGDYKLVYPIKVNQQCEIISKAVEYGAPLGFGLEAGSKPELLAVLAAAEHSMPIICNGYKDDDYIELVLLSQMMGRTVIPIIEKQSELKLILQHAKRLEMRPQLGVRVKLATRGAGRWQSSGGSRSKFGLTVSELLNVVETLEKQQMADSLKLLHFHLGSQITNIRQVKTAINEAARIYVSLKQRGAGLEYLDVGGGLGVDYIGSQSDSQSSINYSLQEYANDVVYQTGIVCDDANVSHPTIISESGRSVSAYHSVLIVEAFDVSRQGTQCQTVRELPESCEQPLHDLMMTLNDVQPNNLLESYHDAQQWLEIAIQSFSVGYLPLEQRVIAENLFFEIVRKIQASTSELEYMSDELRDLDRVLADSYMCNFSLFQSIPDSWAINQLFPIMPIHRLDEKPTRNAVLCDITCDSDGTIGQFTESGAKTKATLPLHAPDDSPYLIGIFLVGAYQEILGDLHNLFGDTHAVHVSLEEDGNFTIESVVPGDTVRSVLSYVQFDEATMTEQIQEHVNESLRSKIIDQEQANHYLNVFRARLGSYTYLTRN